MFDGEGALSSSAGLFSQSYAGHSPLLLSLIDINSKELQR
jgi:hypothetical protein